MKLRMTLTTLAFLILFLPYTQAQAENLTDSAIVGKWLFTHIVMEGGREIKVNQTADFATDGTVVFFLSNGNEFGHGTYSVQPSALTYADKNGEQVWKLVSLENGILHVDHRGAEMFFEKL